MSSHPVFTPSGMMAEDLDALTVGDAALLDTLVRRIRSAARDGSRPHTLLIAPRGGGKTHTLRVALHRALKDSETAHSVLPVVIPEDSLAIGSYVDLLTEIARAVDPRLGETARALRRDKDPVGIEAAIMSTAGDRTILLAIENLDRVFDSLGPAGQGSLRAWVETSAAVLIIATSPVLFAGISSRSYPWYGSFIVETLSELSLEAGATLLSRAARRRGDTELAEFVDSAEGQERLSVIQRLAGGSPRLWHILSDCVDVAALDELVPAVEALLDRLAPHYQQRLWQLPAGEQRLVVELARGWEPRTVGDLAAAVGVSNQSAATALGRLTASHWVTSSKARDGDKRTSWYDLTEPLLRYHLQYRDDRGKPLRLIVEFLRACYLRDRLLTELAQASRRFEQACSVPTPQADLADLVSTIRAWIASDVNTFGELADALDALVSGILGRPYAPADVMEPIVHHAISAAKSARGSVRERLQAGLEVLQPGEWTAEQREALLHIELIWGNVDVRHHVERVPASSAVVGHRTTDLAIQLRLAWAVSLLGRGKADAALAALNDIIDDVAKCDHKPEGADVAWAWWAVATSRTADPTTRPTDDPGVAATGIAVAIGAGQVTWSDLGTIMAAFLPDARSRVAAHLALAARVAGMVARGQGGPLDYVDAQLRPAIERFLNEIDFEASGSVPRSQRRKVSS